MGGVTPKKHTGKHNEDKRIMVRLETNSFASKATAATIPEQARLAVGPNLAQSIIAVQIVKSGFALIPGDALALGNSLGEQTT